MAPIPNPGDGPRDQYGNYYPQYHPTRDARIHAGAPPVHAIAAAGPIVHPLPLARPIAKTPVATPTRIPVAAPPPVAPKPVAMAPKPVDKLVQLQSAVGQTVAQGATLNVSPVVNQGKPGAVTLSLPANLLDVLRDQAAKFGFKRAARKAEVSATLSGNGYAVTPNGPQTAPLAAGKPVKFAWQVTPGQNATGPLRAKIDAALKGQGAPKLLSLATVQSAVVALPVEVTQTASKFHLPALKLPDFAAWFGRHVKLPHMGSTASPAASSPGFHIPLKDRTLPVIGHVSGRAQLAGLLALIAVLILVAISRNMASQRRAAERRRYRTMSAYQPLSMEAEPTTSPT